MGSPGGGNHVDDRRRPAEGSTVAQPAATADPGSGSRLRRFRSGEVAD